MTRQVSGSFDITRNAEPPFDTADGVVLGRMRFDKTFHGPLAATSVVHMTSAMTSVKGSAGYVAVERITGSLEGKAGSFVVRAGRRRRPGRPQLRRADRRRPDRSARGQRAGRRRRVHCGLMISSCIPPGYAYEVTSV